jgi:hypothetical protein
VRRRAGVARFRDHLGSQIEVAAPWYLAAAGISIPKRLLTAVQARAGAGETKTPRGKGRARRSDRPPAAAHDQPQHEQDVVPPLWVLREGTVLGVVSFARSGEPVGASVLAALRARNQRAELVYLSRDREEDVLALGAQLGFKRSFGALSPATKLDLLRGQRGKTMWVGNGAQSLARELVAASAVSASVGSLSSCREDVAETSASNTFSALGDALESAADSVSQARADATESAKLAARRVQFGVSTGAYYSAYGISYGLVFTGVFLKELLPVGNPLRRGFEDGAAAAIEDAAQTVAAFEDVEHPALEEEAGVEAPDAAHKPD